MYFLPVSKKKMLGVFYFEFMMCVFPNKKYYELFYVAQWNFSYGHACTDTKSCKILTKTKGMTEFSVRSQAGLLPPTVIF